MAEDFPATEQGTLAELERLRARDRELSALMASLRELVEVRDVQQLLQKLVDRAHELIGTDLTYLSEYDEGTDELFVRANRGAVSPNMRGLRVPAGVGLASKVVQTRSAQWTAAYDVASFPHESEVTAAVEAERMESILGVPLISSDRVLGVLFAADRSTRTFRAEEIALLTAFADQAAVILERELGEGIPKSQRAMRWGASDFGALESGDMMHFDLGRNMD
jgi:GAF domain-containing protein